MAVEGIEYLYLETRNWGKSVKFWQRLGFVLVLDLGSSGKLEPPGGGAGIFLEEVSPETPLARGVFLRVDSIEIGLEPPVEPVGEPVETHWGNPPPDRPRSRRTRIRPPALSLAGLVAL